MMINFLNNKLMMKKMTTLEKLLNQQRQFKLYHQELLIKIKGNHILQKQRCTLVHDKVYVLPVHQNNQKNLNFIKKEEF